MMMMIQNKKASDFTPMIENRGSYDTKQKVPDGSSSRIPQNACIYCPMASEWFDKRISD